MERMELLVGMLAWADVKNNYYRRISERASEEDREIEAEEHSRRAEVWYDFKLDLEFEILAEAKKKNGYLSTWSEVKKSHRNGEG
tara:strand:+ start:95 stop:349 length:255 start_codon:yes stop_codon:yes gene_type:complete